MGKRTGATAKQPIEVRYCGLMLLCHPNTIRKYREGKIPLEDVIVSESILTGKGQKVSEQFALGQLRVGDIKEAREIIVRRGKYQATKEERDEDRLAHTNKVLRYLDTHLERVDGNRWTMEDWRQLLTSTCRFRFSEQDGLRTQCLKARRAVIDKGGPFRKKIREDIPHDCPVCSL